MPGEAAEKNNSSEENNATDDAPLKRTVAIPAWLPRAYLLAAGTVAGIVITFWGCRNSRVC